MPSIPIYIRKDDYAKWLSIPDKAQFLSDAINELPSHGGFSEEPVKPRARLEAHAEKLLSEIPGLVTGAAFVPKPPDPETGYPCCLGKRPCKHWQWDGNRSAYVNSLTGKERGVAF